MEPELVDILELMLDRIEKLEHRVDATNNLVAEMLTAERTRVQILKSRDAELTAEHIVAVVEQTTIKVDHYVEVLRKFIMKMGYANPEATKGINWTPNWKR